MNTLYLSLEEIVFLHFRVIEDYGGVHGVRNEGHIQSLVAMPKQAFGKELYPSLHDKAAVYLRNTICNHPFIDGNKRTGVVICAAFLLRNNQAMIVSPKKLEDFVVKIAVDRLDTQVVSRWLEKHTTNRYSSS